MFKDSPSIPLKMSELFLILLSLLVEVAQTSEPCLASHGTLTYVDRCPQTTADWNERSHQKKCTDVNQGCTQRKNFKYHCLINEFLNATVEMCAPVTQILGSKCAEYNTIGKRIQDNAELPCKECPFTYDSDSAYEYQECYAGIQRSFQGSNNNTCLQGNNTNTCPIGWLIGAIVSIIFNVILGLLAAYEVVRLLRKRPITENYTGDNTLPNSGSSQLSLGNTTFGSPGVRENDKTSEKAPFLQETARSPTEENTCVAAIQLGERYCGFAFSKGHDPAQVVLNAAGSRPSPTTTARLLMRKGKGDSFEVDMFGYDARKTYIQEKSSNSIYFDELIFKEKEGNMYIKDSRGDDYDAGKIYKEFIKCVVRYAKGEISKDRNISDTRFIFTVPDHWKGKKMSFIRNIIKENVEDGARVEILYACMAVSPFLHEVKEEVLCHNFNVRNLSFIPGTEYAVLNIGTYFCYISILKVEQEDHRTDTIVETYWDSWKRNSPDEWFLKFLSDICGKDAMEKTRTNYPEIYFAMLRDFEDWKEKVAHIRTGIDISISSEFEKVVKRERNSTLESLINYSEYAASMKLISEDGKWKLSVNKDVADRCFSELTKQTVGLVEKYILNRPDVKCVCMTGIYSKVKEVQDSLKKCFYRRTVVIPSIPDLVVAKGAAYHGHKLYVAADKVKS